MKKPTPKKLHLTKETLHGLKDQQLQLLVGGYVTTPHIHCTI